jgi:mono/diheme cytochrome c family protein
MIVVAQMLPRPGWLAPAALAFTAPALLAAGAVSGLAATIPSSLPGDPAGGKTIYDGNCVACHGGSLQGGVGKRLNPIQAGHDNASFIIATVSNGVKGTQMPAWSTANGGSLDDQQIRDVASYLLASQSSRVVGNSGELARSTVAWATVGVLAMLVLTYLLARYNLRWIGRRAREGGRT